MCQVAIEWPHMMSSDVLSGGKTIGYYYSNGRTYSMLSIVIPR